MKGVVYEMCFKLPYMVNNTKCITLEDLNMKTLLEKFKQLSKQYYHLDFNISSQVVYNLHSRPHKVKQILKDMVEIKKKQLEPTRYICRNIRKPYTKRIIKLSDNQNLLLESEC